MSYCTAGQLLKQIVFIHRPLCGFVFVFFFVSFLFFFGFFLLGFSPWESPPLSVWNAPPISRPDQAIQRRTRASRHSPQSRLGHPKIVHQKKPKWPASACARVCCCKRSAILTLQKRLKSDDSPFNCFSLSLYISLSAAVAAVFGKETKDGRGYAETNRADHTYSKKTFDREPC